jgi:hypothetical protein
VGMTSNGLSQHLVSSDRKNNVGAPRWWPRLLHQFIFTRASPGFVATDHDIYQSCPKEQS